MKNPLQALVIIAATMISSWASWQYWSGDAIIHLVYAETGAAGRWFEYNPCEISVGTSSIGWTYLMSWLVRLLGLKIALLSQKFILVVAVFSLPLVIWQFFRRHWPDKPGIAMLSALTAAANPGTSFNAPLGMENAVFACLTLSAFFHVSPAIATRKSLASSIAGGLLVGCAVLLRPEGVMVLGIVSLSLLISLFHFGCARQGVIRIAAYYLIALLIIFCGFGFLYQQTGVFFGGASANARVMQARTHSWQLIPGLLFFEPKVFFRAMGYLPLSLSIIALIFFSLRRIFRPSFSFSGACEFFAKRIEIFQAALMVVAAFGLYGFVTGAAHLGRYLIPIIPCAAATFGYCLLKMSEISSPELNRRVISLALLWMISVYSLELYLRARDPGQKLSINLDWITGAAQPEKRQKRTDDLLSRCGIKNASRANPARIACVEVQSRFEFDDRVKIISMDGRVWPIKTPMLFDEQGSVRWLDFMAFFKPDLIIEQPQYVRIDVPDLITDLFAKPNGSATLLTPGLSIRRVQEGLKITYE
ncbi:MAG TPA: hypothetical protein PLM07_09960 [Candidatus Rifleibacterium sp.]|nr:hypothetical protein [Candidatus Rifleibacterium sp.]HPT46212.1 hypothetical protein [Candidatus Rifleibacterium sp.]